MLANPAAERDKASQTFSFYTCSPCPEMDTNKAAPYELSGRRTDHPGNGKSVPALPRLELLVLLSWLLSSDGQKTTVLLEH